MFFFVLACFVLFEVVVFSVSLSFLLDTFRFSDTSSNIPSLNEALDTFSDEFSGSMMLDQVDATEQRESWLKISRSLLETGHNPDLRNRALRIFLDHVRFLFMVFFMSVLELIFLFQ